MKLCTSIESLAAAYPVTVFGVCRDIDLACPMCESIVLAPALRPEGEAQHISSQTRRAGVASSSAQGAVGGGGGACVITEVTLAP